MPMNSDGAIRKAGWLWALPVFALGTAYIYRPLLFNDLISGRLTDTYIQISILQNWSNCLSGFGNCRTPNYFFPFRGTLGYNDGYLISGAIFHLYRRLGFDPLIAYELVYVTIRGIGFAAVILFCVKMLRLPMWAAIFAAWVGLISINLLNQVEHSQLIYAAFVPLGFVLLLWVLGMIARLDDAPDATLSRRIVAAVLLLGGIFAAWAVTAFYSFFFFFFITLLFLIAYAVVRPRHALDVARRLIRHPGIAVCIVISAALTPLAVWIVYRGTLLKTGAHAWYTIYNPRLYDLFNVGPESLIWTVVLSPIYAALSGSPMVHSELAVGFPLLFLCCFVFCSAYLVRLAWRAPAAPIHDDHAGIAIALAIAALLAVLLIVQVGNGITGWKLFWTILPGAKAIRVPSRFFIFVTPLICIVVAYVTARIYRHHSAKGNGAAAGVAALILLLTVEQYNTRPNFVLPRTSELAFFNSVPKPPAGCRAFYVAMPRLGPTGSMELDRYYVHSVDAMMIAALHRIPTVNGMASFLPAGWNLLGPFEPDYRARVASYAKQHGVAAGLCELDLKALRWSAG